MSQLDLKLLTTDEFLDVDFESSIKGANSKGSYNPMQFVIRLRKDIHDALKRNDLSIERIQAFSTLMHENIHWWQHVGSHLGFLTSLSFPALAHTLHRDLTTLIKKNEKYKPIIRYDKEYFKKKGKYDNAEVNSILNYYHDILYAKAFILDNKNIHKIKNDKRFFLHMGHCFHILWSSSIHALATSIDPHYDFLPNIYNWTPNFKKLEEEKKTGFFINSSMTIANLGTHAIYEGQARFNQLQYLTIAFKNKYSYRDFEKLGMLNGIYIEAFNLFLDITEIERPDNLNNSIIGVFLLLCDIAINPSDGFPFDIFHYETFIISNDPGLRFTMLCQVIKKDKNKWISAINKYSKEEYIKYSEELCKSIYCHPTLYASKIISNWVEENDSVKELLEEESKMKFKPKNMEIRLFASKYIRFQQDKIAYPMIFCWPGKSMTSEACEEITIPLVEKIFNKHQALFIDDEDGTIKPIIFENYSLEDIETTFNLFYAYNTSQDMIIKWVKEDGEFKYDYQWLTTKQSETVMKNWIRNNFKEIFGIFPEELEII